MGLHEVKMTPEEVDDLKKLKLYELSICAEIEDDGNAYEDAAYHRIDRDGAHDTTDAARHGVTVLTRVE